MSPLLRILYSRRMSLADIADVVERHLGTGADGTRCKEAYDALCRIRQDAPNHYLRAALRGLDRAEEPCERVRRVIATLRKWRHVSGA